MSLRSASSRTWQAAGLGLRRRPGGVGVKHELPRAAANGRVRRRGLRRGKDGVSALERLAGWAHARARHTEAPRRHAQQRAQRINSKGALCCRRHVFAQRVQRDEARRQRRRRR